MSARFDLLSNELLAVDSFCHVEVVCSAEHPEVLHVVGAASCVGLSVVDLQRRTSRTPLATRTVVLAAVARPLQDCVPERHRHVA